LRVEDADVDDEVLGGFDLKVERSGELFRDFGDGVAIRCVREVSEVAKALVESSNASTEVR